MERFDVERIIGGLGLNDPPLLELAAVLELATVSQSLALEPLPLRPGLCHQDAFIRKVERPPDPPVFFSANGGAGVNGCTIIMECSYLVFVGHKAPTTTIVMMAPSPKFSDLSKNRLSVL